MGVATVEVTEEPVIEASQVVNGVTLEEAQSEEFQGMYAHLPPLLPLISHRLTSLLYIPFIHLAYIFYAFTSLPSPFFTLSDAAKEAVVDALKVPAEDVTITAVTEVTTTLPHCHIQQHNIYITNIVVNNRHTVSSTLT